MFGTVQSKFNTMEECLCGTAKPLPSSPILGSLAGILALKTSELHEVNKDTSFTNINDVGEFCHNHAHPHTHTYIRLHEICYVCYCICAYVCFILLFLAPPLLSLSLLCYPPISYSSPTSPLLSVYISPFSSLTYSYIFPTSLPPHPLTSPSLSSHLTTPSTLLTLPFLTSSATTAFPISVCNHSPCRQAGREGPCQGAQSSSALGPVCQPTGPLRGSQG